jgi:eukaryotic-like serine/threonine-protein kinase
MICPTCRRAIADPEQLFCHEDGARLVASVEMGEPPIPPARPVDVPAIREAVVHPTREIGAVVEGRYVIRGFIGEGGMARIYLAEDVRSGEKVALKILRREHAGNQGSRERFLRELDVAATLVHPSIARILDAGERPDRVPFMVLEYLSGESMGDVLERERRFAEPWALALVKDAASALVAAHAAGVVHRDVKPDNLFLTVDGRLKVVDFGFAKLKEGSLTATGMTVGTVPYMAPEQALADPVDGRTDVYGLGVTMFHMLTGSLPFDSASDARLVAAHLYVPAPAPSSRCAGLDPRVDRVVQAALHKRPVHRYPTMQALLEDVERILGQRPGPVAPPPPPAPDADTYVPENPMSRAAARYLRGLVP